MSESQVRVALVAGGSGLVGSRLLAALLDAPDWGRVYALSRRPLPLEHPRLANRIVQFEHLEKQLAGVRCDDAFCCLGTTLRAAGSEEAFRLVDLGHVLKFARAAHAGGARRLVVVSSVGADPGSKRLYLRTKGEMEEGLAALGFASLDILQPSLLLGLRRETRPLELAAQIVAPLVSPLLFGPRSIYRAISARTVAAAMLGAARSGRKGVYRYTWEGLRQLAAAKAPAASARAL